MNSQKLSQAQVRRGSVSRERSREPMTWGGWQGGQGWAAETESWTQLGCLGLSSVAIPEYFRQVKNGGLFDSEFWKLGSSRI